MVRKKIVYVVMVVFLALLCMANDGCDGKPQQSSSGAQQIRALTKIPLNSKGLTTEQDNIDGRIKVTTDPTKVLWIHLIALDGNIIRRMPVRFKVTSSGKRLEPKHAANAYNSSYPKAGVGNYETDEFIQPDGTYGDSDPYIYWFDPMGRYHQWGTAGGLGYLITDYPIDLKNPVDEITGLYKVQQQALEWQKTQEALLKKQEEELKTKTPPSSPTEKKEAPARPEKRVNLK